MDLFERLESINEGSGAGGAKGALFNQLKEALKLHTKLEEQTFCPTPMAHRIVTSKRTVEKAGKTSVESRVAYNMGRGAAKGA